MRSTIFSLLLIPVFLSCSSSAKKEEEKKNEYRQATETLAEREMKKPADFITVVARDRKNLIGQTVVKGVLTNKAKVTTYYDVLLERSFFSKTGALLEKDRETIYERIAPGSQAEFKSKLYAPKGSDSVHLNVIEAKADHN